MLASAGLPRSQGWDRTIRRLEDDDEVYPAATLALEQALLEHYICGEKQSIFFKLSMDEIGALREAARQLHAPDNALREAFPFVASADRLHDATREPVLLHVEEFDQGIAVLFGSVREVSVREEISRADLPSAVSEELGAYDELVGIRHTLHQAMDILWIPIASPYVELRIDAPSGTQQETLDAATQRLVVKCAEINPSLTVQPRLNLFPAIKALYEAADEGTVVELAFATTTASLKHEKMRLKKICLRRERYHSAGMMAIARDISPYKLSIIWHRATAAEVSSVPELSLSSSARIAAADQPTLYRAVISNCVNLSDYEFVRDRLIRHLLQP
jgi:hypothetical protein